MACKTKTGNKALPQGNMIVEVLQTGELQAKKAAENLFTNFYPIEIIEQGYE